MTAAELADLAEEIQRTADLLRTTPLARLEQPTAAGERSRAASALAVVQMLADLDAVLRDGDGRIPADDDVVWVGAASVGDQLAAVGRELGDSLRMRGADSDPAAQAALACAKDALVTLRMEL